VTSLGVSQASGDSITIPLATLIYDDLNKKLFKSNDLDCGRISRVNTCNGKILGVRYKLNIPKAAYKEVSQINLITEVEKAASSIAL
jgi:hypothetical protein